MAITDSLISYWAMDEASGSALDSHGSNNLTETGGTIGTATGKVSNARDFEAGDTEWFAHADNSDLSVGDIDFTWMLWVNAESFGTFRDFLYKGDAGYSNYEYSMFYSSSVNRFRFSVSNGSGSFGDVIANNLGAPSTATWYCLFGWHDSVNNEVGIQANNGTPNTTSYSSGSTNTTSEMRLGANNFGDYWDGLIDEVAFWKRILTADEKTWLYNSGSGRAYSELNAASGASSWYHNLQQALTS